MLRLHVMVFLFLWVVLGPLPQIFAQAEDEELDAVFPFLFIHHSVGGNWLSSNSGGLRDALEDPAQNDFLFEVHDATYGDTIGDDTDVCHWYPKFQNQMNLVLKFDSSPDHYYTDPKVLNRVVLFKTCYTGSDISEEGTPPGDPTSTDKTLWNYMAAYVACAQVFAQYPHILFVAVTAPPRNRDSSAYSVERGLYAWEFNQWFRNDYVASYRLSTGLNNLAVFDWFSILAEPKTDPAAPGALKEIYSNGGTDSHPNAAGGQAGTAAFIPWFNNVMHEWRRFRGHKNTFRVSTADSVYLYLHAQASHAARPYLIMGTFSGVYPGATMGVLGIHLPLNYDPWTDWTLIYGNSAFLPGFQGYLDVNSEAVAAIHSNKALPTSMLGFTMHYVYLVHKPIDYASCVVPITFVN